MSKKTPYIVGWITMDASGKERKRYHMLVSYEGRGKPYTNTLGPGVKSVAACGSIIEWGGIIKRELTPAEWKYRACKSCLYSLEVYRRRLREAEAEKQQQKN